MGVTYLRGLGQIVLFSLAVATAAGAAPAAYRLGPGDEVEISVWRDADLTRQLVVPPDGVLSFPLVGDVDVRDLTVPGLREVVREKIDPYVPDATVTVILLRSNSMTAYVIGKVHKPGQFPITLDTSVLQVLAMAGGPTPYASAGGIEVLRKTGTETTRLLFDYEALAKGKDLERNVRLEPGDVVVVP